MVPTDDTPARSTFSCHLPDLVIILLQLATHLSAPTDKFILEAPCPCSAPTSNLYLVKPSSAGLTCTSTSHWPVELDVLAAGDATHQCPSPPVHVTPPPFPPHLCWLPHVKPRPCRGSGDQHHHSGTGQTIPKHNQKELHHLERWQRHEKPVRMAEAAALAVCGGVADAPRSTTVGHSDARCRSRRWQRRGASSAARRAVGGLA